MLVLSFCLSMLGACTVTSALDTSPYSIPSTRYAAIVMDSRGKVLHAVRPDAIRFPASLTKMMTMYMAFGAMKAGKMNRSTLITISNNASRRPASKLYLKPGSTITVDKALQALAVKSANDVATAMAEHLGGTEANFARMMTAKARALGMTSTTFRNASGLPDKRQVSTARDMAKLGFALKNHFPQYYSYFGKSSLVFRGKTIRGHNKVLKMVRGTDGIKTGYTRASGYNLATSIRTRRGRYVAVILGEKSGRVRNKHMVQLLKKYAR